eukprot:CAMPEP_0201511362 /NCGR_PEP_ID=MMETSP0161_2-20130828/3840_1 /ASSEMBLY_ACC=CAM_ASM_000251 /TAXON_ID=180227 /ORGANISM="Neoparamoeba aestuarina, Strain SoJaBio B1-5/56/2" /LENGTH=221 /DNA_ID=CAMNT_0047906831 /DNA_START=147 /DNA_END=812 /DNA_ORIENTATION=+
MWSEQPHPGANLLKLQLISSDGGEHSSLYRAENVLNNSNSVYCTVKNKNINLVFKWDREKEEKEKEKEKAKRDGRKGGRGDVEEDKGKRGGGPFFCLSHFTVKAPTSGFSSPIRDGMIFITRDKPDVSETTHFDGFTLEDYHLFLKRKREKGEELAEKDPAAFFSLKQTNCIVQRLNVPTSGMYVHVKLIRPSGDHRNIDIEFLGFYGISGPYSFYSASLC